MSPARVTVRTQGPTGPAGDPTTVADGAIAAAKIGVRRAYVSAQDVEQAWRAEAPIVNRARRS